MLDHAAAHRRPIVDAELAALIPPLRPVERDGLERSLLVEGCRDALLTWGGVLLDGHNRLSLCEAHGIPYRVEEVPGIADRLDARVWIRQHQGARRNLSDDQRAMLAVGLQEDLSEQARRDRAKAAGEARAQHAERDGAGAFVSSLPQAYCGKLDDSDPTRVLKDDELEDEFDEDGRVIVRRRRTPAPRVSLGEDAEVIVPVGWDEATAADRPPAQPPKRDTRAEAAASVGVSRHKVQRAKAITEARPDLADRVKAGDLTLTEAARTARQDAAVQAAAATLEASPAVPPAVDLRHCRNEDLLAEVTSAALIHADPDWPYDNQRLNGTTDGHYGQSGMADIVATLDRAYDCAADDAYLLLWCTMPMLADWFAASASQMRWRYLSAGAWAKTGRLGSGFHWRGDAEVVLLYRRGNPRPRQRNTSNAHVGPRSEHSEKPLAWLADLVATFAGQGELVLDLYAGRAPLARACRDALRAYVGAEADEGRHTLASAALAVHVATPRATP